MGELSTKKNVTVLILPILPKLVRVSSKDSVLEAFHICAVLTLWQAERHFCHLGVIHNCHHFHERTQRTLGGRGSRATVRFFK